MNTIPLRRKSRNRGSFLPTSITGCIGWYDPSDPDTITQSGGFVSQLNDKSGNARHVVQATGINQPGTGTRTINGRNVLNYDGTNDQLMVVAGSAIIGAATGYTMFAVCDTDTRDANLRCVVDIRDSGNAVPLATLTVSSTVTFDRVGIHRDVANVLVKVGSSSATGQRLLIFSWNGTTGANGLTAWINGVSGTATAPGLLSANMNTLVLGNNNSLTGQYDGGIGEVVCYNSALDATNRGLVENYLKSKWGFSY